MAIGKLCVREVAVANRDTPVAEAAKVMRQLHVGDLVIVDQAGGKSKPVGIVTDRDIVLSVVATGLDPAVFTVGDLQIKDLVIGRESDGIFETIELMRNHGVRRIPVVDAEGGLIGILSADDLIQLIAIELGELGKLISRERSEEVQTRR